MKNATEQMGWSGRIFKNTECHLWNAKKTRGKNRTFWPWFLTIFCSKTTTYSGWPVSFALRTTIRHQNYTLNVPWGYKNDVVKTHWFLGGGVFLLKTDLKIHIFEFSPPLFHIGSAIISVRHIAVLLQHYQLIRIVRNKTFKLVVVWELYSEQLFNCLDKIFFHNQSWFEESHCSSFILCD